MDIHKIANNCDFIHWNIILITWFSYVQIQDLVYGSICEFNMFNYWNNAYYFDNPVKHEQRAFSRSSLMNVTFWSYYAREIYGMSNLVLAAMWSAMQSLCNDCFTGIL